MDDYYPPNTPDPSYSQMAHDILAAVIGLPTIVLIIVAVWLIWRASPAQRARRAEKRQYDLDHVVRRTERTHLPAGPVGGLPVCPHCGMVLREEPADGSSCPYCAATLKVVRR
jgi:hypothetical protein